MQRKVSVSVHSVSGAQRWLLAGSVGCQNRNICGKTEKWEYGVHKQQPWKSHLRLALKKSLPNTNCCPNLEQCSATKVKENLSLAICPTKISSCLYSKEATLFPSPEFWAILQGEIDHLFLQIYFINTSGIISDIYCDVFDTRSPNWRKLNASSYHALDLVIPIWEEQSSPKMDEKKIRNFIWKVLTPDIDMHYMR